MILPADGSSSLSVWSSPSLCSLSPFSASSAIVSTSISCSGSTAAINGGNSGVSVPSADDASGDVGGDGGGDGCGDGGGDGGCEAVDVGDAGGGGVAVSSDDADTDASSPLST